MDRDTWNIEGKVCLITGPTNGIGLETARELARRGARLRLAARSEPSARALIERLRAERPDVDAVWLPLDLGSLGSVRQCAQRFVERDEPLHLLVHNAGTAGERGLSVDGFEKVFATNHLGPFLLNQLLDSKLRASAPARIVVVASHAHYRAKPIDFGTLRSPAGFVRSVFFYSRSKLANVLFARELAHRLEGSGVAVAYLHPGVVASRIWRRVPPPFEWILKRFMVDNVRGAQTTIFCATTPALEHGAYYDDHQEVRRPSRVARDEALVRRLWAESEALVAPFATPLS